MAFPGVGKKRRRKKAPSLPSTQIFLKIDLFTCTNMHKHKHTHMRRGKPYRRHLLSLLDEEAYSQHVVDSSVKKADVRLLSKPQGLCPTLFFLAARS